MILFGLNLVLLTTSDILFLNKSEAPWITSCAASSTKFSLILSMKFPPRGGVYSFFLCDKSTLSNVPHHNYDI